MNRIRLRIAAITLVVMTIIAGLLGTGVEPASAYVSNMGWNTTCSPSVDHCSAWTGSYSWGAGIVYNTTFDHIFSPSYPTGIWQIVVLQTTYTGQPIGNALVLYDKDNAYPHMLPYGSGSLSAYGVLDIASPLDSTTVVNPIWTSCGNLSPGGNYGDGVLADYGATGQLMCVGNDGQWYQNGTWDSRNTSLIKINQYQITSGGVTRWHIRIGIDTP